MFILFDVAFLCRGICPTDILAPVKNQACAKIFIMHTHSKSAAATLEGLADKVGSCLASGNLAGKQFPELIRNVAKVLRLFYPLGTPNTCFFNGNLELR